MLLGQPLSLNVIRTFRGVADLYYYRNTPVARKWPRNPKQPNTPAQLAARAKLSQMHTILKSLPAQWHDDWKNVYTATGRTVEDLKRKTILNALNQDAWVTPPKIVAVKRVDDQYAHVCRLYVKCSADTTTDQAEQVIFYYHYARASKDVLKYYEDYILVLRDGYLCKFVRPDMGDWHKVSEQTWYLSTHTFILEFPLSLLPVMVLMKHWSTEAPE